MNLPTVTAVRREPSGRHRSTGGAAAVRDIGAGATIGIGTIVEIGADIGEGCVVGALTFVPKFARLAPRAVYAGIPARMLEADHR